jgi:hypothetical protein
LLPDVATRQRPLPMSLPAPCATCTGRKEAICCCSASPCPALRATSRQLVAAGIASELRTLGWLDFYLGPPKGHWKNSLKIGHVTNTYIGGMYAFTMNSHDPKGLMRL